MSRSGLPFCLRILSRYRTLIPPAATKERGDAGDIPTLLPPPPGRWRPSLTYITFFKPQMANRLSAALFSLDSVSQYSPANAREYWETPSGYGGRFQSLLAHGAKDWENKEKFLLFGGKRYSCRPPPDFRCFPAQQRKSKEERKCLTAGATTR